AEDSGASWVTVHARTRSDFYRTDAQWEWIGQVKTAVGIPVVGNGDVRSARDVVRLMQSTGCDAAMIGRAAMGYPFIFREVEHLLTSGSECAPPTPQERLDAAATQLRWSVEQWSEERAVREFRKHLLAYVRGLPRATLFKVDAMKLERAADVIQALSDYLLSLPDQPFPRPEQQSD
ncbi:MAG: tRNA-dihydrouridine synthase, partial [bacterium]|nr:tRNA-dihydrouridine synthase [bacterium]